MRVYVCARGLACLERLLESPRLPFWMSSAALGTPFDHFDKCFKESSCKCLCVKLLVCACACACADVLACWYTRELWHMCAVPRVGMIEVYFHIHTHFRLYVSVGPPVPGLFRRLCVKICSFIIGLCPKGWVQGGGLSENQARAERARRF